MNKKIVYIVILLSLAVHLIGCGGKSEESVKRIVLESDVRDKKLGEKNNNSKVTVEKINLKLDEGDYFEPAFYHEGEVYGSIDKGYGIVSGLDKATATHPISGYMKEYLYKVDENNSLIKTSKEVFDRVWGAKVLGFKMNEDDKVFSIDYKKEDKIKEIPELTKVINELKKRSGYDDSLYFVRPNLENENYVVIYVGMASNKRKMYLYDMKSKKLYDIHDKEHGESGYFKTFNYVESLQSLVWINKDLKIYKLKLQQENAFLEQYINLDKYIGSNQKDKIDNVRKVMINSDEMLLFQDKYVSELGYYMHHPLYKTISISKFNFKTNQYRVLFEVPDDINMYANYIGNNMLTLEEFKQNDKNVESIIPINRYIKEIRNDELNIIYKEKTEDEGETMYPHVDATISDDGREIFLTRHLCKLQDGVETTKDAIYKKYTIR